MSLRVYFFERADGSVISVDGDREAWQLYAHPTRVFVNERPPKLIGTSDGAHYYQKMDEAKTVAKEGNVSLAQDLMRKAFDEEVSIARKTVIPPPNYDRVDKFGNPA